MADLGYSGCRQSDWFSLGFLSRGLFGPSGWHNSPFLKVKKTSKARIDRLNGAMRNFFSPSWWLASGRVVSPPRLGGVMVLWERRSRQKHETLRARRSWSYELTAFSHSQASKVVRHFLSNYRKTARPGSIVGRLSLAVTSLKKSPC